MKIKAAWILIATGAVLLPLLVLQSSDAKRNNKREERRSTNHAKRIARSSATKQPSITLQPTQQPSPEKKVAPELAKSPAGDENGSDVIAVDQMSSAGRLAQLAATGKLAKAIAKARAKAGFAALPASGSGDDEEGGDDDEGEGPAGGQAELSIAVDSTGQHIVVGVNDTRGFSLSPVSVSGFTYSDDGGVTFVDGGQLPTPGVGAGSIAADSIGGTNYPQVFGDPEVEYIGGSTFIYFSICVKTIIGPLGKRAVQTMCVHRSTDNGHTWTGPYEVTTVTNPHAAFSATTGNPRDAADKEFADVDRDTGRVMISWSNFTPFAPGGVEISTTFSDNITANPPTWSARQIVGATAADGQASIPGFAGNGSANAYVAWRRFPGGNNQNVGFSRSTNNGASWSAPINLTSNFFTMDYVLGNDRPNTSPSLAVDTSSGPNQGNIYVVYGNNNNHDGLDIAFQRSTDTGLNFSLPIILDSRPGSDRAQWFPWVNVDKNTGRVYVFYYDQGIAANGDLTETTYLFSDDGGGTWSKPMPLTDRPFHAGWGNDTGQPNLGDYNQAVAQGGELFVVWAGTELKGFADGQPSASMTTPDIFFKRAPAVKTSLDLGAVTFTDGNANGFIDAGEQVSLKMPLRNYVTNPLSAGTVTGITGTLSTTTPGVTVTQAASTYPSLPAGAAAANNTDYMLQLSPGFVPGTHIELVLSVSSAQGNNTLLFTQATGTPGATVLLSENFNGVAPGALPAGWATSHAGGANIVPWTTNNTFFGTSSNAAFHANANDGVGGTGNPTRFERLFSPAFVVPANAEYVTVDMDVAYDTEDDPSFNILAYDGFLLRVTDGTPGRTLRSLLAEAIEEELRTGSIQHYPKHFPRNSSTSYFEDMSAWAGDSQGFKHVHMKFPGPGGLAGATAQLRFEFAQDGFGTCADVRPGHQCGVMFDNLVVQSVVSVQADLAVSKTAVSDTVTTGDNVTYKITATNNGPSTANSVVVTDNLPSSVTFVSCSSTGSGVCGGSGNNRTVTFASLASGASETITLVATLDCSVADGTTVNNTATISSATPDNDSSNNSSTKQITASNPPPVVMNISASPNSLWPPNHQMVDVTVNYDVTDNCAGVNCQLTVTSNEPINGLGDGDTSPDWEIVDAHHVRLRSERSGTGSGRIYTIKITCTDSAGNITVKTVTVSVPKSQGKS